MMAERPAFDRKPHDGSPRAGRFAGVLLAGCLSILLASCRNFSVPSSSNVPTLLLGDIVMALPFGAGPEAGTPARGDMAAFRLPRDRTTYYIKRVVGLPGDRIRMRRGRLVINGAEVRREPAGTYPFKDELGRDRRVPKYVEILPNGSRHEIIEIQADNGYFDNTDEYVVPAGHYFTMGDNRDNVLRLA